MMKSPTIKVTLDSETFLAFQRLATEDGRTPANALAWLAKYAVTYNTLCPMATPPNMPTDEALRRITAALSEPWEPERPAHIDA